MKKIIFICMFLILPLEICFANSSRFSTSSRTSYAGYPTPSENQCNTEIDYCFDRYCYSSKTLTDNLYSVCGAEPATKILSNVNECLKTREIIKSLDLTDGCSDYAYNRVLKNISNKDRIEVGLKQNTDECQKAMKALGAAKNCYAIMISHTGEIDYDLYDDLDRLCGFEASGDSYMLNRFYHAGDYGKSNVGAIEDMRLTGQNTVKRENWRQVVDATMVSYAELAELACGMEDYDIGKVNQFELDDRNNLAMVEAKETAKEIGKQTATRIVDGWFAKGDCLKADIPTGGSRWTFDENKSPSCRLICKEGYNVNSNYNSCLKEKEEKEASSFIGLNFGGWVDEPVYVAPEEPSVNYDLPSLSSNSPDGFREEISIPFSNVNVGSVCSKSLPKKTWYPSKGKEGVCDVFFPNGRTKIYDRNTSAGALNQNEFYCTGNSSNNFDGWYFMHLGELNDIFGTNYETMGNDYKSAMSLHIKNYCLDGNGGGDIPAGTGGGSEYLTQNDDDPVVEDDDDVNNNFSNSNADIACSSLKSLPSTVDKIEEWKNAVNTYGKDCQASKDNFSIALSGFYTNKSRDEVADYLVSKVGNYIYGVNNLLTSSMDDFRNCVCKEVQVEYNNNLNNYNCQVIKELNLKDSSILTDYDFSRIASRINDNYNVFTKASKMNILNNHKSNLEVVKNIGHTDTSMKTAKEEFDDLMDDLESKVCK